MADLKNLSPEELDELVFNAPTSPKPDYAYWKKMAYWDINEAIYLTFNICPESDYNPPKEYSKKHSPTSQQVQKLGNIARRAIKSKELTDPVKPSDYIQWLRHIKVDIPEQLNELLVQKKTNTVKTDIEKPLHTKEKETLLKMIAGMAVDGYGYDPAAKKSPIPSEISSGLAEQGISLDTDTVRKWLKEAAQIIPQTD